MPDRSVTPANAPPVRQTASVAANSKGLGEVTAMCLSARERRTLSCIAGELTHSAPELASLLSVFNRLTSGEDMPERPQAGKTGECERQRSRRSCQRTWIQRQASQVCQRAWPAMALPAFMSIAMIVTALILSHTSHKWALHAIVADSLPRSVEMRTYRWRDHVPSVDVHGNSDAGTALPVCRPRGQKRGL